MEKLRKQIRESFFNPVLHFLPILIYIVLDEFAGMSLAWKISFPIALLLLIYIYFVYNRIFTWHIIFTSIFVGVALISGLEFLIPMSVLATRFISELVFCGFLIAIIIFRKTFQRKVLRVMSRMIPMTNNFDELFRCIFLLLMVILFYVVASVVLHLFKQDTLARVQMLQYLYLGSLVFVTANEILHVQLIRAKLVREEWWPIVTDQGKIIGGIQHLTSLNDERKYMHPVVRVLFVDNSLILLQQRSVNSSISPGLWDSTIANHLQMGETIEQCVERTAQERYSLSNFKYMFLANYTVELEKEKHYAFLFVSCQQVELKINYAHVDKLKWWTQQQIEENLNSGIFTENFKKEFELLKRSGLLETGVCECDCKLKEAIYQQAKESDSE